MSCLQSILGTVSVYCACFSLPFFPVSLTQYRIKFINHPLTLSHSPLSLTHSLTHSPSRNIWLDYKYCHFLMDVAGVRKPCDHQKVSKNSACRRQVSGSITQPPTHPFTHSLACSLAHPLTPAQSLSYLVPPTEQQNIL